MPIEHVTGWLFQVARHRIVDLFRKKRPDLLDDATVSDEGDEFLRLEDLLPSPDAGPEALYARRVLLEEIELAIDELPEEQREVFIAHELLGTSFKEMAATTGVNLNTLLSRNATPSLICASAYERCTTNSTICEDHDHETETDLSGPFGPGGIRTVHRSCGVVVRALWNWLLPPLFGWHSITFCRRSQCWRCAGFCSADSICAARPLRHSPPHGRALGTHDSRGAGAGPASVAWVLEFRPRHPREQGP